MHPHIREDTKFFLIKYPRFGCLHFVSFIFIFILNISNHSGIRFISLHFREVFCRHRNLFFRGPFDVLPFSRHIIQNQIFTELIFRYRKIFVFESIQVWYM